MKIITKYITLFSLFLVTGLFAQDVTTVTASNTDISDNLDLRAVASIFGESRDLEDFEKRLNDPRAKISNLDLNNDNYVDYIRVIEAVEGNTHLIILQSVLGQDLYQDIATIEVEKDRNNNVQVQVVGDVYMYGHNYIYEPVYVDRPYIYNVFWVSSYRPYYSPWYWGYYPTYYTYWEPYPVYRYRNNIYVHINRHNYNYVNTRRSSRAIAMHNTRRADGYERQNPNTSFTRRNSNLDNRYALEQTRSQNNTRNTNINQTRNSFQNNSARNVNTANTRNSGLNTTREANVPVRQNNTNLPVRNTRTENIQTAPVRNTSNPVRSNPVNNDIRSSNIGRSSGIQRSTNVPAVRNSQPVNTPAVRTAPAAPRQNMPARTPSNNAGRRG